MKSAIWTRMALALLAASVIGAGLRADNAGKRALRDKVTFGLLQAPGPDEARNRALAWLKAAGKDDAATIASFEALWKGDRPLLDRVAGTLELGDADAQKLLDEARDAKTPAPTTVPAVIKDAKRPAFYRANLAL